MNKTLLIILLVVILAVLLTTFIVSFILYIKTPAPKIEQDINIENCKNCSVKGCKVNIYNLESKEQDIPQEGDEK